MANTINLSSAKPSPKGQIRMERIWSREERPQGSGQDSPETLGWVRGNQNKEKSLFKSPHPNLLLEGEGAYIQINSIAINHAVNKEQNR